MSVINQVLNQLDQRGAPAAAEQTMVRVVPPGRRSLALPLIALFLVLASGVLAWQWTQTRKPVAVEEKAALRQPAMPITVAASAVADADAAVDASGTQAVEMLPPASRLSFELSTIPLPSTLRSFDSGRDGGLGQAQGMLRTDQELSLAGVASAPDGGEKHAPGEACPEPCKQDNRPGEATLPGRNAKPQSVQAATSNARPVAPPSGSVSPLKHVSTAQRADAEFNKAVALMQQGHVADAIAGYEAVLRIDAGHAAARQSLVAMLLENKRGVEAGSVLQEGLRNKPEHTGFAMLLARLQVEQGAVDKAAATLEKSLPYADTQADYHAFFAALRQRQNRHKEAIVHYQIALQLAPDNGVWLMGYGISLQAVQRDEDAGVAYRRAIESRTLSPELQAFVQQKLRGL